MIGAHYIESRPALDFAARQSCVKALPTKIWYPHDCNTGARLYGKYSLLMCCRLDKCIKTFLLLTPPKPDNSAQNGLQVGVGSGVNSILHYSSR